MAIVVTCEACQKRLKVPEKSAGKRGKCPHCQAVIQIPPAAAPAPAAPQPGADEVPLAGDTGQTPVPQSPPAAPAAPVAPHPVAKKPLSPALKFGLPIGAAVLAISAILITVLSMGGEEPDAEEARNRKAAKKAAVPKKEVKPPPPASWDIAGEKLEKTPGGLFRFRGREASLTDIITGIEQAAQRQIEARHYKQAMTSYEKRDALLAAAGQMTDVPAADASIVSRAKRLASDALGHQKIKQLIAGCKYAEAYKLAYQLLEANPGNGENTFWLVRSVLESRNLTPLEVDRKALVAQLEAAVKTDPGHLWNRLLLTALVQTSPDELFEPLHQRPSTQQRNRPLLFLQAVQKLAPAPVEFILGESSLKALRELDYRDFLAGQAVRFFDRTGRTFMLGPDGLVYMIDLALPSTELRAYVVTWDGWRWDLLRGGARLQEPDKKKGIPGGWKLNLAPLQAGSFEELIQVIRDQNFLCAPDIDKADFPLGTTEKSQAASGLRPQDHRTAPSRPRRRGRGRRSQGRARSHRQSKTGKEQLVMSFSESGSFHAPIGQNRSPVYFSRRLRPEARDPLNRLSREMGSGLVKSGAAPPNNRRTARKKTGGDQAAVGGKLGQIVRRIAQLRLDTETAQWYCGIGMKPSANGDGQEGLVLTRPHPYAIQTFQDKKGRYVVLTSGQRLYILEGGNRLEIVDQNNATLTFAYSRKSVPEAIVNFAEKDPRRRQRYGLDRVGTDEALTAWKKQIILKSRDALGAATRQLLAEAFNVPLKGEKRYGTKELALTVLDEIKRNGTRAYFERLNQVLSMVVPLKVRDMRPSAAKLGKGNLRGDLDRFMVDPRKKLYVARLTGREDRNILFMEKSGNDPEKMVNQTRSIPVWQVVSIRPDGKATGVFYSQSDIARLDENIYRFLTTGYVDHPTLSAINFFRGGGGYIPSPEVTPMAYSAYRGTGAVWEEVVRDHRGVTRRRRPTAWERFEVEIYGGRPGASGGGRSSRRSRKRGRSHSAGSGGKNRLAELGDKLAALPEAGKNGVNPKALFDQVSNMGCPSNPWLESTLLKWTAQEANHRMTAGDFNVGLTLNADACMAQERIRRRVGLDTSVFSRVPQAEDVTRLGKQLAYYCDIQNQSYVLLGQRARGLARLGLTDSAKVVSNQIRRQIAHFLVPTLAQAMDYVNAYGFQAPQGLLKRHDDYLKRLSQLSPLWQAEAPLLAFIDQRGQDKDVMAKADQILTDISPIAAKLGQGVFSRELSAKATAFLKLAPPPIQWMKLQNLLREKELPILLAPDAARVDMAVAGLRLEVIDREKIALLLGELTTPDNLFDPARRKGVFQSSSERGAQLYFRLAPYFSQIGRDDLAGVAYEMASTRYRDLAREALRKARTDEAYKKHLLYRYNALVCLMAVGAIRPNLPGLGGLTGGFLADIDAQMSRLAIEWRRRGFNPARMNGLLSRLRDKAEQIRALIYSDIYSGKRTRFWWWTYDWLPDRPEKLVKYAAERQAKLEPQQAPSRGRRGRRRRR